MRARRPPRSCDNVVVTLKPGVLPLVERSRGQPGGCSDACAASARGPRCAAVEIAVLLSKMRKRNPAGFTLDCPYQSSRGAGGRAGRGLQYTS